MHGFDTDLIMKPLIWLADPGIRSANLHMRGDASNYGFWHLTVINFHPTTIIWVGTIQTCNVHRIWSSSIPAYNRCPQLRLHTAFRREHVALHAWWSHNGRRMWKSHTHVKHARVHLKSGQSPRQTWRFIKYIYPWAVPLQCLAFKFWRHSNRARSIGGQANSPNYARQQRGKIVCNEAIFGNLKYESLMTEIC